MALWDEIETAIQQAMHFLGGSNPVAGPPSPNNPNPQGFGQPGGTLGNAPTLQELLPLLLEGGQTFGAIQYGGSELQAMQDIYNMQKQAARMAMGIQPGQLGVQAAHMAQPLNKQLAYQLLSNAAGANELSGMAQSPGATASGQAKELVPAEQQNLAIGAQLAQAAQSGDISRLSPAFAMTAPNYMAGLSGAGQLGQSTAIPPYLLNQLGGLGGLGGLLGSLGGFYGLGVR